MNTAAAVDGNKLYPISTFTHVQGAVLDFKQIQAKGGVKLLSIKQPLLNSSQVRNVPSVITVSPVRQTVSREVHSFVKIRSFVTGFSFYWRLKIIYLLGTKIKPVNFFSSFLFYFLMCLLAGKKQPPPKNIYSPFCSCCSLWSVSYFGNTNTIYFGGDCHQILPPWKKCYPKSAQLEKCTDNPGPGAKRCSGTSHRYVHTSPERGLADQALAFNVPFKGLD